MMLLFTMHGHQRIELIVNDTEYTSVLVVDDQIVKLIVYARKQTIFQRFVKVCKHLNINQAIEHRCV